ncbi:MAG: phenylalanine--tRNA ligase subunit beta [Chloroflexota bacterium]|nr:phenylalanine--tRNA ligase subunit beta [Chloroflexota bacterium]
MKIPLSWLRDYVDITLPVQELVERLTLAGMEVESTERIGSEWSREHIFVGQVLEVKAHPNADRLTLATVEYGMGRPLTVVTGAPNLPIGSSGQKVAFAIAGARLIDGYSEELRYITLKPSRIRGVLSEAMVCSEKELGLSDYHEGILILPDDAPVGTPLADYLGDVVLEFDIKGPFAHLESVTGIARETAALTGQELRDDVLTILDREEVEINPHAPFLELEIADPDLCARYSAALIRDVTIDESPPWMQQRLLKAGMRPLNVIVDITNYVMLELGQPLHAFDYHALRGRTPEANRPVIIVRRAREGERMTTLDGVARSLDDEMLLITDGGGAVAIAGVMGGAETEVTEGTADVLLESANFLFTNIRRTSQALKLPSEAANRFGKQIDPELTMKGLARACQLMEELAGGEVEPVYADLYPHPREIPTIEFDPAEVERILGVEVETGEIVRVLGSLGFNCEVAGVSPPLLQVTPPSHRLDISRPVDLVEEVGRVIGYDKLPATLLRDELPPQRPNPVLEGRERVRDILVGCGLQEVIAYSLTSPEAEARLWPAGSQPPEKEYVRLRNPLTSDRTVMRRTLMPGLLGTIASNQRYVDRVAIFEVGRVYLPREGQVLPDEPNRLGIALTGPRFSASWLTSEEGDLEFFDLKGIIEALLERLGVSGASFVPIEHPTFQPGRVAQLEVDGMELGLLGEVHPDVRAEFDLGERRVCLAEFDLDSLLASVSPEMHMTPISRFPAVRRDLAMVVDDTIPAIRVQEEIKAAGGELLREVTLFDLYHGKAVPPGQKSLAYSLAYQALDRTLTDEEVDEVHERIVEHLAVQLDAQLRS